MDLVVGRGRYDTSAPAWILRHHTPSPIHALKLLRLSSKEEGSTDEHVYILAGDAEGRVSLTALRDVRPRLYWKAHASSVLSVDIVAFDASTLAILTSGRDNELVAWRLAIHDASLMIMPSRIQDDLPKPDKLANFGINALNYCAFSACRYNGSTLVAMPHSMDSGYVDIIKLPSGMRVSKAIGKPDIVSKGNRAPMIMSMHLFTIGHSLHLLAGYEDGYVKLWRIEGDDAELCWAHRKHSESIMATAVAHDATNAVSVAADDVVARYGFSNAGDAITGSLKSMGHASVTIRGEDGKVAVGGWDGSVRVFDQTLNRTTRLQYHKDTVQAIATLEDRIFPRACLHSSQDEHDSDSDASSIEATGKKASDANDCESLLLTGGKEGRICLWRLA